MEFNFFKDWLFDLINDNGIEVFDLVENDGKNLLWLVMYDGSVFRLESKQEPFCFFGP